MRTLAVAMGLAAALCLGTVVQASETMQAIVGSYLETHAALAADKLDGVKPAARAIAERAAGLGASGEAIVKAAKDLEQAADLKSARAAFGPLSDAVTAAARAEGWKDLDDVKLAYCPMAKKHWLQKDDTIKNPYYGSSMLKCGEFKTR